MSSAALQKRYRAKGGIAQQRQQRAVQRQEAKAKVLRAQLQTQAEGLSIEQLQSVLDFAASMVAGS